MARVRIATPERFSFRTAIPVRITDINYGGHLGNDAVLSIVHEARMQFLRSLGHSELDIGGASLIMSDVAISYRDESFYGDVLTAEVAAADIGARSFDLIFRLSTQAEKEIAIAKTGMVAFNYTEKRVCELPAAFCAKLNRNS